MLNQRISFCNNLATLHFWCTLCGVLCFIPCYPIALCCFTIGANSLYIALCYGGFDSFLPLVKLCGYWLVAFPFSYVIAYYYAVKRRVYFPFLLLVCIDGLISIFSMVLELLRDNTHGAMLVMPDVVISTIYCTLLIVAVSLYRKVQRTQQNAEIEFTESKNLK